MAYCLYGDRQEDPEEFFSLYLDAVGKELKALIAPITLPKPASDTPWPGIEGPRKGSQSGEVLVPTVRQLFLFLCAEHDVADRTTGMNRASQSSRPSPASSVESSAPPCVCQTSPILCSSKTGYHSPSSSWYIAPSACTYVLMTNLRTLHTE